MYFRYTSPVSSLHIIFATTSGHTEFVAESVFSHTKERRADIEVEMQRAETAAAADVLRGDVIVLASSTWNTGNVEGQLNPMMYNFVFNTAKDVDLSGKKVAVIGLGDERYFYTVAAADHLETFVKAHHGTLIEPTLRILNEPYDQIDTITAWTDQLLDSQFSSSHS
jgi:flavodoxin